MQKHKGIKQIEFRKRKREIVYTCLIGLFLVLFTWGQFHLYEISHKLPFYHSIFFFGLVNLNIVLLMFLSFFVFRNITKVFVERKGRLIGSSLQAKLITAFLAFSFIPTFLIFLVSVFYINSSFDKWFSVKTLSVLKDSLEIPNYFYVYSKQKNYHFAERVAGEMRSPRLIRRDLERLREKYSLDAVEYYPDFFSDRYMAVDKSISLQELPRLSLELLEKAINDNSEASTIHASGEGNLVRVIVPVGDKSNLSKGAVVVSTFLPISIVSKMAGITSAYESFRDVDPLESPIKSIYLILLVMVTLVILAVASWFGFHLAKELSIPLMRLSNAFKKITKGIYEPIDLKTGSSEMEKLVKNFNFMTEELDRSEKIVKKANSNLKRALDVLDEHSKYIEVVISNISTGVISFDLDGKIKTMNQKAQTLLRIRQKKVLNKNYGEILPKEMAEVLSEMQKSLQDGGLRSLKREFVLKENEDALILQLTYSTLRDDNQNVIGFVLVFDDLSLLVNAQRAAAWREVARRIAHEIKNPLTPIQLSAQRLNKKFENQVDDPAFKECTDTIIEQVSSLKNMVNEFSNFARLPQAKPVESDIHEILQSVCNLYESAHKDLKIKKHLAADTPRFYFDPEQIRRVLVNLFDNSVASMQHKASKEIQIASFFDANLKLVRLEVEDSGTGVQPEALSRLFEPYFTTKKEGSGLGLAIVKRIIQDHNGFIRAYNKEEGGLKFVIELPIETKWSLPLEG